MVNTLLKSSNWFFLYLTTYKDIVFVQFMHTNFKKSNIFATNFSHKIMSNLLIISSFKLKL